MSDGVRMFLLDISADKTIIANTEVWTGSTCQTKLAL